MASILLSNQDLEIIQEYVDLGRFSSASEVVHAAIVAFDEHERLKALRAAIDEGDADFDRGEYYVWTPNFTENLLREIREEDAASNQLPDKE